MSALCQKRTSGKLSQRCCQHSKAAGQVSNQRLCLRSQRGLGLHRWVVEPARPCPSAQEGTCSVRPRKKLTVPLAVLRQINCQPGRKKAVAFDRDQIVGRLQQQRREEIRLRILVSQLISPSRGVCSAKSMFQTHNRICYTPGTVSGWRKKPSGSFPKVSVVKRWLPNDRMSTCCVLSLTI